MPLRHKNSRVGATAKVDGEDQNVNNGTRTCCTATKTHPIKGPRLEGRRLDRTVLHEGIDLDARPPALLIYALEQYSYASAPFRRPTKLALLYRKPCTARLASGGSSERKGLQTSLCVFRGDLP